MSFLDELSPEHRDLFESAGIPLKIHRGRHLMRRGEAGGDIFLLRSGALEVVDARSSPEIVLACLEPGAVVGELGFLDDAPRSADVRSTTDSVVLRWGRDDLRALMAREPAFASDFFETLARLAAGRLRNISRTVASGVNAAPAAGAPEAASTSRVIRSDARVVAERAKAGFIAAEAREATESADGAAVEGVLQRLEADLADIQTAHPELEDAVEAARLITRELHPYLVRSVLAGRCIRRPEPASSTAVLLHVQTGEAQGDGHLGRTVDRWLLDRPTMRAVRGMRDPVIRMVETCLTRTGSRRVTVLDATNPSFVGRLAAAIAHPGTLLTVVDPSHEKLNACRQVVGDRVRFVGVADHPARLALGKGEARHEPADVVVLSGLLEYLPDSAASGLLAFAGRLAGRDGTVLATALGPDADEALFSWLLSWPAIRRSREAFRRVIRAARLEIRAEPVVEPPGMLMACRLS